MLIPAFNESSNIEKVLGELAVFNFGGIIVVDDGSTDSTSDLASSMGATVLRHPINQGVGAALRTGLSYAKSFELDWILQVDGDGQHSVGSIREMLTHSTADLTIGTRDWKNYQFGLTRSAAQKLLIFTLRLNGVRGVNDPTSGFRLYGKKAINFYSETMPSNFIGDTVEALILGAKAGLRIESQVVQMAPRHSGESSHDGLRIARAFIVAFLYAISYTTKRGKPC